VVRGSRVFTFVHVAQLAAELGLPAPYEDPVGALADIVSILDSWIGCLGAAPWPVLLEPTQSKGRSCRRLTATAFARCDGLPVYWESRCHDYGSTAEPWVDEQLTRRELLLEWAGGVRGRVASFAAAHPDTSLAEVVVDGERGAMPFSRLADFHRRFVAYHHRQLVDFLRSRDVALPAATIDIDTLGLPLPTALY
jgi:hypothetical protein